MKNRRWALLLVAVFALAFLGGCQSKEATPARMEFSPRVFNDKEAELIQSINSAELLTYNYVVEERVKEVKLSLLELNEEGLWTVIKDAPFATAGTHGQLTIEFYPDLVALSSVIDGTPALKAANLNMYHPDTTWATLNESQEIIPGRTFPVLMIFAAPKPEGGYRSMTHEGWGDSSILLEEGARYALTVTFFE